MELKGSISILGSGGWGTALAIMARKYDHDVTLWSPFKKEINGILRFGENKKLLPGVPVPPGICLTTEIEEAVQAELIIFAVPSFAVSSTAKLIADIIKPNTIIANAGKGLEIGTHRRFSEVLTELLPTARVVALSGPSHAEEVARDIPTTIISASKDVEAAERVQELLMNPNFRIYVNTDVMGVELGGAMKNVIALSAGICDGLGLGDNTKAALMTRGLTEIARLGVNMGARSATFAGLSGMGDLIVTCASPHSRNRRAGILIGQGHSPQEAVHLVGTVEGYHAALAGYELARSVGVDMPITEQCWGVCYNNQSPRDSISVLMERPRCHETENEWVF
ncbi:MAG: NAD(P)-dependent glycerol-3-phosphate dehydrogenase [Oscillospiraceae bacterium]|nr:NAD(P)-dependent glycerol-3-phosphate dehydrogenase [Oscillospiraceae bacterium]MDD4413856.1 NAD(P)-dependent glycerol-3-phosphate dehydrogenase [Oscillospiraceae bacterium]